MRFLQEVIWNEKIEKVKIFIENEGYLTSHSRNEDQYDERLLAYWCDDNRRNSKISDERKEKLQSIGFYNM